MLALGLPLLLLLLLAVLYNLDGVVLAGHLLIGVGEAEVDNFDVAVLVKQHVLGLQIPMDYAQLVQIVYSVDDLVEKPARLSLSKSTCTN